jgi:hypothetical protein
MRPSKSTFVALAVLLMIPIGGCGPITPANLAMKAGMWAAKEVVTKEIKRQHEDRHSPKSQPYRAPTTQHED